MKTLIRMIETNIEHVNSVIQVYRPSTLTIFEGMRKTIAADAFPSLEIEPTNGSNQWATTRAQRPRYNFNCTLTILNDNEDFGVEYLTTVATALTEIMTDPQNLQLRVINEVKWSPNKGLVDTYIIDSLVENVTYNTQKDGALRICEFDWFALIHEPFPATSFNIFWDNAPQPVSIRPMEITIPQ